MPTMTTDDLRDALYEAQEHLYEAIRLIETYVSQTNDHNAEAYLLDHLRIFAGRNHGFLSNDLNLDDLIDQLAEGDDEDDEEETDPYPKTKLSATGATLYLLQNNNGPVLTSFGEPMYVTIPED